MLLTFPRPKSFDEEEELIVLWSKSMSSLKSKECREKEVLLVSDLPPLLLLRLVSSDLIETDLAILVRNYLFFWGCSDFRSIRYFQMTGFAISIFLLLLVSEDLSPRYRAADSKNEKAQKFRKGLPNFSVNRIWPVQKHCDECVRKTSESRGERRWQTSAENRTFVQIRSFVRFSFSASIVSSALPVSLFS